MQLFIVILSILFATTKALPFPQQPNLEQSNPTTVQQNSSPLKQHQQQESNQNDQALAATIDKDTNYASSLLDNPSYDANLYSSFIPQDAIQQYVNHFGGGAYAPYTASVFPPPAPFAVQTGYEGFLVPDVGGMGDAGGIGVPIFGGPITFLKGLIPKFFIAWLIKSAAVILSTIGVVFFGAAITTAVCTLTPLCSISFSRIPLFQWQNTAEAVGKAIGTEITPERIKRTVEFVRTAIDKFTELQKTIKNESNDYVNKKEIEDKSQD